MRLEEWVRPECAESKAGRDSVECGGGKVWIYLSVLYFGKSYPFSSVLP